MLTEPRRQGSTTKSLGLTRASFSIQASQHSTLNTGYSTLNTGSLCLLWVVLLLVAWVLRGALREVVVFGAIPRMSPPLRPPPRHHRRRRWNTFAVMPASPPASPWLRHRHPPRRRTPPARDSCAVHATPSMSQGAPHRGDPPRATHCPWQPRHWWYCSHHSVAGPRPAR